MEPISPTFSLTWVSSGTKTTHNNSVYLLIEQTARFIFLQWMRIVVGGEYKCWKTNITPHLALLTSGPGFLVILVKLIRQDTFEEILLCKYTKS